MTATARAALADAFPGRAVESLTAVTAGNSKETTLARLDDGRAVVVQVGGSVEVRESGALASAIRARTSVPVPAVLARGVVEDRGYLVTEHAAGEDLHTTFAGLALGTQRALARSFGATLAALHDAFVFVGYGPVSLAGSEPAAAVAEWEPWFRDYARVGVEALPPAFDPLKEAIEGALAEPVPKRPPSRLYPWDLRPGNALIEGGELTALLDWDAPLAADPGLALAKVEHLVCDWYVEDGAPLRGAFRAGYASHRPLPEVPRAYRVAAVVHSAVDSHREVTRPGYPEHHGEEALAFHRARLEAALAGQG